MSDVVEPLEALDASRALGTAIPALGRYEMVLDHGPSRPVDHGQATGLIRLRQVF
jgi:hypothetical protein